MTLGHKNPSRSPEQTSTDTNREQTLIITRRLAGVSFTNLIANISLEISDLNRNTKLRPPNLEDVDESAVFIDLLRRIKGDLRHCVVIKPALPLDATDTYGNNHEFPGNHIAPLPIIPVGRPSEIGKVHTLPPVPEMSAMPEESFQGAA
ncbi:MAG: hypothetical protein V4702_06170 [Patescibacteria group bacterium]